MLQCKQNLKLSFITAFIGLESVITALERFEASLTILSNVQAYKIPRNNSA